MHFRLDDQIAALVCTHHTNLQMAVIITSRHNVLIHSKQTVQGGPENTGTGFNEVIVSVLKTQARGSMRSL